MDNPIFVDFLESESLFEECARYWAGLTQEVERAVGAEGRWHRWIPETYADGHLLIDRTARPIFDGRRDDISRAYRILQGPPVESIRDGISAWVESYGSDRAIEMPREELFISVVLSPRTAKVASSLLAKWLLPSTTVEQMRRFIPTVL